MKYWSWKPESGVNFGDDITGYLLDKLVPGKHEWVEPEVKEVILEIVYKTIIAENPEMIELIYTMLNVGIEKDQIIKVLKSQLKSNKEQQ